MKEVCRPSWRCALSVYLTIEAFRFGPLFCLCDHVFFCISRGAALHRAPGLFIEWMCNFSLARRPIHTQTCVMAKKKILLRISPPRRGGGHGDRDSRGRTAGVAHQAKESTLSRRLGASRRICWKWMNLLRRLLGANFTLRRREFGPANCFSYRYLWRSGSRPARTRY